MGALELPDTVSFGAAANPADIAAGCWELAPSTANRFCHLDWDLPLAVFTESIVTGQWPTLPVHQARLGLPAELARWKVLLAGTCGPGRPSSARCRRMRSAGAGPSRLRAPGPTQCSWLRWPAAFAWVRRCCSCWCLPASAQLPVTSSGWTDAQDLPDPEELLADPSLIDFAGMRPGRLYVVLQSVLSAVISKPTASRWETAIELCAKAARQDGSTQRSLSYSLSSVPALDLPGRACPRASGCSRGRCH